MATDFKTLIGVAFDKNQAQNELNRQIKSLQQNAKLTFGVDLSSKEATKNINDINKAWSNYRKEAVSAITAPNTELQKMSKYYKDLESNIQMQISNQKKLTLAEEQAYKMNEKMKQSSANLGFGKIQLDNNITSYLKNNTKLTSDFKSELSNIQKQLTTVNSSDGLKNLNNQFRNLKSSADALGVSGDTAFTKLGNHVKELLGFFSSATIVMGSIRAIQGLVSEVKNLDSAMIDLRKVTDESDSTYNNFLNNSANSAKKLGSEISSIVSMTAEWARAGYNLRDSSKLAEISTIFQNVADVDVKTSVSDIITPLKAFNLEASKAIDVVNALNEVDNKFSVSAADIGDGLKNSASALALAGNDLNQSIALITGGSEITQNADEMGNAIKVLSMRLRGMKGDLESIGEEYDNILPVSKIQTQIYNLTKGTVNIMDDLDPTKFKSTYEIIQGISKVWSQISETDQAQLLEIVAGKQRGNQISALIQSFQSGQAQKALETAIGSTNSALNEQEKYMKSIQYSADRMKASFQELSNDTINSGWIKGFYDLSNILINITDKIGIFNIALVALAGVIGTKTTLGMTAFQGVLEKSIIKMGVGATAAETLGMALSTMIPAALIIGGITAVVKLYEHLNVTLEEQKQKLEDAKSAYSESTSELESINNELQTTANRIDELNKKGSLTFTEQSELDKLKEANEYLLIQQDILKKQNELNSRDVLNTTVDSFNNGLGKNSISQNQVDKYASTIDYSGMSGDNAIIKAGETNLSLLIAAYEHFNKLKKEAYSSGNQEDIKQYQESLDKISSSLYSNVDDLNEYKKTLESIPYDQLSEEQKNALNSINSGISLIYKNLDPAKWKEISFNKIFDSKDYEDTKNKLNDLSKAGKLDGSVIANSKEYQKLLYDTGLTATEVATQVNALNGVTDKSSGSLSETSNSANETTQSLYSLAESAKSATGYINDLGSNVDISKLQEGIENARSSIDDFNSILQDMKDNGGITGDSLDKIINKYPILLQYVGDESRLREELQKSIKDQTSLAEEYYKQVLDMDTNLYNEVVKNNADRINKLSDDYKTDIKNWQSLAQAKADIDGKLLTELTQKWADYYSTRAKLLNTENAINNADNPILQQSNDLNLFGVGNVSNPNTEFLNKQKQALKDLANQAISAQNNYNSLKSVFTGVDYSGKIASGISNTKKTPDKSKSSKSEFSQELDNIARSVDIAEKSVEKLNNAIDNDAPIQKQIDGLDKLIKKQKELSATYTKAANAYKSEYEKSISGLSSKYIKQIESGGSFDIQDFKGESGEKLYNQISTAQKYWDNYKDSLNDVTKITKEIVENTTKLKELNVDKILKPFSTKYEKQKGTLDDISQALNFVDEGSTEQIQLYQAGLYAASKSVENLKKEITALNNAYKDKSDVNYKTRLSDLKDQLNEASSSMKSYQDDIVNAMKKDYEDQTDVLKESLDNQVDAIEKAHDSIIDSLNEQLDAYKDIIDAKKESLKATEDEYQYQKSISEKTKNISSINDRIAELSKAANSGDRTAAAEIKKLQDDLANAQTDLDDAQHDHKVDLEEDALDKAYSDYEKLINGEIDLENKNYENAKTNAQNIYDFKKSQLDTLYATESDYITQAAALTSASFSSVFANINSILSSYGLTMSSGLSSVLKNTNSSLPVLPNIGVAAGAAYGISKSLKTSTYATGGVVGAPDNSNNWVKRLTGEDGILLAKKEEGILKPRETDAFIKFGNHASEFLNLFDTYKSNLLSSNNYTTNNTNAPSFEINIPISGNADASTVNDIKNATKDIVNKITDIIMKKTRIS